MGNCLSEKDIKIQEASIVRTKIGKTFFHCPELNDMASGTR